MNKTEVQNYVNQVSPQLSRTKTLIAGLTNPNKGQQGDAAAFDSMVLVAGKNDREVGLKAMPQPLVALLSDSSIYDPSANVDSRQAVFDGLNDGITEYKRRNGGENPPASVVLSAISQAVAFTKSAPKGNNGDVQFDSLTMSHHEALSVVPAAVQVVITSGIANALPLIAMLPNPMGSNEVPIVYGTYTASMTMGAMTKGHAIDGEEAGLPYIDNIHILQMKDKTGGVFELESHIAYTKGLRANKTTKFEVDATSPLAPFLGGRVRVLVKGNEVAHDRNRDHPTKSGVSALQPVGTVTVGTNSYAVVSGQADLDTHKITVTFDTTKTVPTAEDVEVEIVFDYERKDDTGKFILRAPGTDMAFNHQSIFAYPIRAQSDATVDAITQAANELGINWYGATQQIFMQKFYFEQTARLLRAAYNQCLYSADDHLLTYDATKNGVNPARMEDLFATVRVTLGRGRAKLSKLTNTPVAGYDLYVSDKGAAFFEGLGSDIYTPTGESYGDQYSVYRIGTLNSTGANLYYVPTSMGVFNEDNSVGTAYALQIARTSDSARAPFVGTVAVPPMVLASNVNAFTSDVAIYTRQGAQRNPIPRFSKQFVLIELLNLPAL